MERAALEQLKRMQESGHRIQLSLLPHQALMLVDLIQTACLHVESDGAARECGRDLVHTVMPFFGRETALGQVIEDGWKVVR